MAGAQGQVQELGDEVVGRFLEGSPVAVGDAAGLVVLTWPDITLTVVAVLAGLALVVAGALRATMALEQRRVSSDSSLQLAVGIATLVVLGFLLGLRAIFTSLFAMAMGWKMHQLAR